MKKTNDKKMKAKTHLKKAAAVMMAMLLCIGAVTTALAMVPTTGDGGIAAPQNIAIIATTNNLTMSTSGKLTCEGKTEVQPGYNAGVIVELQRYNGSWKTIKTWEDSDDLIAAVGEDWYVTKGFTYRLKLTHKAYDSNWNQVESFTKYSREVS